MVSFFETRSYWQGGSTDDEQKYYKGYRLSKKGIYLWKLINQLGSYARNLCSIYDKSFCCDESSCPMMFKHLPFQCACNDNEILTSYAKGYYNFYEVEQVEQFVIFKGAYEITSFVTTIDDAPYKSENLAILQHCYDNYKDNFYIAEFLERMFALQEETNALQEPMEEETAESGSSLDEKEEESDEQKEEEWISYPCIPSNESNSLSLTLFHYLIALHAYQRRMNVMFLWILLKYSL